MLVHNSWLQIVHLSLNSCQTLDPLARVVKTFKGSGFMIGGECPLWVKSRHSEWSCFMSALHPKADIKLHVLECPLIAIGGPSGVTNLCVVARSHDLFKLSLFRYLPRFFCLPILNLQNELLAH